MSDFKKGYTYILLSLASAVTFTLLADFLFRQNPSIHPANLLFWSIAGATLIASPYFVGIKKQRAKLLKLIKSDYKTLLLIGIVSFTGATLWNFALKESSSGIVTLLGKTTFLITILMGVFFFKEKISKKEILALCVMIVGLLLVANLEGEVSLIANIYMILCCCCYATLSLMIKQLGKSADMKSVAYLRASLVSVFLFIYLSFTGDLSLPNKQVLTLGPISEVFGIILWAIFYFEAHRYLPMSKLNVFSVTDVAIIPLFAFIIFGDSLSLQKILGATFVIIGILWFFRQQMKQEPPITQ